MKSSFRRYAWMLVVFSLVSPFPAIPSLQAQSLEAQSSSSYGPNPDRGAKTDAELEAQAAGQAAAAQTGAQSVQARIRLRKQQRRLAAIREVYTHKYEAYVGGGYLRFTPGPYLQRSNETAWDAGFTRYFNERLGVTLDGRGNYSNAYTYNNPYNISNPEVSQYAVLLGPTYRFYLKPKYSISGRVMGGFLLANFSGDTNGEGTALLGLYPDGYAFGANASISAEYNVSPELGVRVTPEYFLTTFGSTTQNNRGFTASIVYRWGKQ